MKDETASDPHLHELHAGVEGVVKPEQQQEVLLHGQQLCELQVVMISNIGHGQDQGAFIFHLVYQSFSDKDFG